MSSRFYTTSIDTENGTARLEESEAHHLLHVMRLKTGSEVHLFDGNGNAWRAFLTGTSRRSAELRLEEQIAKASLPTREIVLAVAPPKGDRFRWLVEKATELGVSAIQPLKTERSVVDPGAGKIDKLRQTMIAACKQCGRNQLMTFAQQQTWEECIQEYTASHHLLIAHPHGHNLREAFIGVEPTRSLLIAIGPEGGFTEEEVSLALNAGAAPISLGQNILRTETAAITCAAMATLA
ncbi:Ribosomal RNA small subunit methyltransferase E [Polystyrenella longa]|uniref:Ribosomal RNA small subunit methyltransferase E n=1 Tax=Polystyrenella longa TaxID=2528007 RepID=A0A518CSQ1_9PLAN|nr:16S rRNA (uracil(1498)-N(3))-methyltransferase [Polystyrenella longa]QDU82261.1 Ribosomal RNA small subunit methyltransferase E [Polystyrenella longa]